MMAYNWVCCKKNHDYDHKYCKKTRESPSHSGEADFGCIVQVTWHDLRPKVSVCHLDFGGPWALSANII